MTSAPPEDASHVFQLFQRHLVLLGSGIPTLSRKVQDRGSIRSRVINLAELTLEKQGGRQMFMEYKLLQVANLELPD